MSRRRNICSQIDHVLRSSRQFGASKRSAKFDGEMQNHIYSISHYEGLEDAAHRLSGFLDSKGIHMLYAVTPEDIKEYLSDRAKTCNENTMAKEVSYVRKLETLTAHVYKGATICWGTERIKPGDYHAMDSSYSKDKVISRSLAEMIIQNIKEHGRTQAWKAILISYSLGMRIDECTKTSRENFRFLPDKGDKNDRYGFGYYVLPKGHNSKGNRPRVIPIHSKEDREMLRSLCGDRPTGFIIENARKAGMPVTSGAISNQLRDAMKRLGIYELFKGTQVHGLRKFFAQEVYDIERIAGASRTDAGDTVQEQLGHGKGRNERLQNTYIHNRW